MFGRRRGRHRRRDIHVYDAVPDGAGDDGAGDGGAGDGAGDEGAGGSGSVADAGRVDAGGETREGPEGVSGEHAVAAPGGGLDVRRDGPWDSEEAAPDRPRIDLGALLIPDGTEHRIHTTTVEGQIVGVTIVEGPNAVQVQALAAPKSAEIWDEVRQDLMHDLRASGGGADEADGRFGVEVRAQVPVEAAGRKRILLPARMVGVDGPRWMLRGTFAGPAAYDPIAAERLEDVFRGIVVVRGGEPLPPREPLRLRPPASEGGGEGEDDPSGDGESGHDHPRYDRLPPFGPGPETTETR